MTDQQLRQALLGLSIAPAAWHLGRFQPPMRVQCPVCPRELPAGWGRRWRCEDCGRGGDVVDYLRAGGLSFAQARTVVLAERKGWVAWARQALRTAMPMPMVLGLLGIAMVGNRIRCLDPQAHRRGDSRPSCAVYVDGVHCFACGFHADAVGVWQRVQGCDFRTAWEALLRQAQDGAVRIGAANVVLPQRPLRDGRDFVPLYDKVMACCEPLPATAGADYLAERGIDAVAGHELGVRWASNAALGRIQHLLESLPGATAVDAGLLDRRGLFTLRRQRLLFPACWDGHVVWLQGRSTRTGVAGANRWRSLSGIRAWPLGLALLERAKPDEPVFVGEGSTDWLAMAVREWTTIGVPGAQAIATTWLRLLVGRRVVLAHDGDDAGDMGARLWRERLRPFRAVPQRLPLPSGIDPCDYLRRRMSHDPLGSLPEPMALPDS